MDRPTTKQNRSELEIKLAKARQDLLNLHTGEQERLEKVRLARVQAEEKATNSSRQKEEQANNALRLAKAQEEIDAAFARANLAKTTNPLKTPSVAAPVTPSASQLAEIQERLDAAYARKKPVPHVSIDKPADVIVNAPTDVFAPTAPANTAEIPVGELNVEPEIKVRDLENEYQQIEEERKSGLRLIGEGERVKREKDLLKKLAGMKGKPKK